MPGRTRLSYPRWTAAILIGLACVSACPRAGNAGFTVIPIPEVITDPNEGTTVGFLPVTLITNEAKTIRTIIAPDVRYNDTLGVYPTLRVFDYPDAKQKYVIMGGKGSKMGEYVEASYVGHDLHDGRFDLRASAIHEQDPFERFYGFGNHTPKSHEANFTSTTEFVSVYTGVNFFGSFQAFWQPRLRHRRIGRGGIHNIAQVRDQSSRFADVNGVSGATIVGQQFGLAYDTRDTHDIPTEGVFLNGAIEVVDKALGSTASFVRYDFEGKAFIPLRPDKKFILALHAVLDYLQDGEDAPFYEKNSLGGIHSLRAFGGNRFTDNHRFFFREELRTNVYERELFGVRAHLELAPFIDIGKVFHSSREFPLEDLHIVGGLGVRAVIVPQVVAYVDFGTSGGSPAVYTGIDYPF
jgi:outer membrane protein assembly factor BamA